MKATQELIIEITNAIPGWSGLRVQSVDVEVDNEEFTIVVDFLEFDDPEVITIASYPAPSIEAATTQFVKELIKMFYEFRKVEPDYESLVLTVCATPEQLREDMESLGWDYDLGVMKWNPDRRN